MKLLKALTVPNALKKVCVFLTALFDSVHFSFFQVTFGVYTFPAYVKIKRVSFTDRFRVVFFFWAFDCVFPHKTPHDPCNSCKG